MQQCRKAYELTGFFSCGKKAVISSWSKAWSFAVKAGLFSNVPSYSRLFRSAWLCVIRVWGIILSSLKKRNISVATPLIRTIKMARMKMYPPKAFVKSGVMCWSIGDSVSCIEFNAILEWDSFNHLGEIIKSWLPSPGLFGSQAQSHLRYNGDLV